MTTVEPELRRVYGACPTGVTAVAGLVRNRPVRIAASSFVFRVQDLGVSDDIAPLVFHAGGFRRLI